MILRKDGLIGPSIDYDCDNFIIFHYIFFIHHSTFNCVGFTSRDTFWFFHQIWIAQHSSNHWGFMGYSHLCHEIWVYQKCIDGSTHGTEATRKFISYKNAWIYLNTRWLYQSFLACLYSFIMSHNHNVKTH